MRSWMSARPTVLSGCVPCCFVSEVRPSPRSEPTLRTAATTIAVQTPMVRHGWVALLRAKRSVNPVLVFGEVLR